MAICKKVADVDLKCLVMFPPIIIFAFYQWTLQDSWLSTFFSVLLLLFIVACILYPAFLTLRMVRHNTPHYLFTNVDYLAAHGPLYAQYRNPRYYFSIILIFATFLKALFVAFAKANGEVQVILMVVVEFGVVAAHLVLRPSKTRGGDILASYLAIVRFVCTALMVAFIETLALAAIPRVAIGIVIAVLHSISVIFLFINIAIHLPGATRLFKYSKHSQQGSAIGSILEKGDISHHSSVESQTRLSRPRNPTPDRNVPLGPHVIQSYAEITPTQTPAEPPSPASVNSSSTNLGSTLPRRWSFQQSHSSPRSQSNHSIVPHSTDFSSTQTTFGPSLLLLMDPIDS
jgi:hypothetical protein